MTSVTVFGVTITQGEFIREVLILVPLTVGLYMLVLFWQDKQWAARQPDNQVTKLIAWMFFWVMAIVDAVLTSALFWTLASLITRPSGYIPETPGVFAVRVMTGLSFFGLLGVPIIFATVRWRTYEAEKARRDWSRRA